jgi:hypothetical protein
VEWFDCSYRQAWTNYHDPDQGLALYQTLLQRPEVMSNFPHWCLMLTFSKLKASTKSKVEVPA